MKYFLYLASRTDKGKKRTEVGKEECLRESRGIILSVANTLITLRGNECTVVAILPLPGRHREI